MMPILKRFSFSAALLIVVSQWILPAQAHAEDAAPYAVEKTVPVSGEGRWDYVMFDADSHRLYVTRSTHTQIIDMTNGKVTADVQGQKRAHGAAVATAAGRGFISDGGDSAIVVFDLKSGDVLGKITAAADADSIAYDRSTDRIAVGCGEPGKLAVFKAGDDLKDAKADLVDLGGSAESLVTDDGKAYVDINDKSEVAVVDLKSLKVTARWSTGTGSKPMGLAIDPAHHRLFVGCRNEKLIVMSSEDGHISAELAIGKGNDACGFDPGTGEAFASCGNGTLAVVKETSPGKFEVSTVTTKPGARTMAVDPTTHTVYLPAAEMEPAKEGQRPAMKPGTFMIVVVAPTQKK